ELSIDTCCNRHVFKRAVTTVVKETIAGRTENTRRAVVPGACRRITIRAVRNRKISVVHHHQIEPAITIVVEKTRGGAPTRIVGRRVLRHIVKRTVAFVEIHLVRTEIGEIEIGPTIVVDVADSGAHAVTSRNDATLFSYVSEPELLLFQIVSKESAARCALHEEDIEITIIVVIEQRAARTHDLG